MIASQPHPKTASPAIAQTGLVLVVDDYDDARFLVMCALHRSKITCIEASTGEEALERVKADPEAIEAIVLDVMMPGIDGFEVARRLQEVPATAGIPILMVTASATEDRDVVRGVEHGVVDYITKPCSPSVLVAKVRSACERTRETRRLKRELAIAEGHTTVDALTGLFNRSHFEVRLNEAGAYAKRHREEFSLVLLSPSTKPRASETQRSGTAPLRILPKPFGPRCGGKIWPFASTSTSSPFELTDGRYSCLTISGGTAAVAGGEDFSRADLTLRAEMAHAEAKAAGGDRII